MKNSLVSFTFCLSVLWITPAYSQIADTLTQQARKWYQTKAFKTAAVPSLLISYGFLTVGNNGFPYNSYEAYQDIQQHFPGFNTKVDNITTLVPAFAVYGLNAVGVKGKHRFADRTLLLGFSGAIANVASLGLKRNVERLRPDESNNFSFPSGHTTNAFVCAEFMHQEYKDESVWYSVAGYTVASATGVMRMLNNRHWLSDVLVGAGIGMLSTKVTYLVYPLVEQKISRSKHQQLGLMPVYNGGGVSLVLVVVCK
jgi:membrane-associated phospholipid phosphatase